MRKMRRKQKADISDTVAVLHKLSARMTPPDPQFLAHLEQTLLRESDHARSIAESPETIDAPAKGIRPWLPRRVLWASSSAVLSLTIVALIVIGSISWFAVREGIPNTRTSISSSGSVVEPLKEVLWTNQFPEGAASSSSSTPIASDERITVESVISGDTFVRLSTQSAFSVLEGFDAATGALKWRREIDRRKNPLSESLRHGRLAADDSHVYLYFRDLEDFNVRVIDPNTGEDVRILRVDAPINSVVSNGFQAVIADADKNLTAFDVPDGRKLWSVAGVADSSSLPTSQPYVGGFVIVAIGNDGELIAIESGNGRERWRISTGLSSESIEMQKWSFFDQSQRVLVVGTSAGGAEQIEHLIMSVNLEDGTVDWQSKFEAAWTRGISLGTRQVYVLAVTPAQASASSNDAIESVVFAFDRASGNLDWNSAANGIDYGDAVLTNNGYLSVQQSWQRVVVFQAHNGRVACIGSLPEGVLVDAIAYEKSIIYSYMDGSLVAIDVGRSCDLDASN